jgi:subtilisin family serine protease
MFARFARPLVLASICALGTLTHAPAGAVPGARRDEPLATPHIHPHASLAFSYLTKTGRTFPSFRQSPRFERTGELPIVVRFRTRLTDEKVAHLRTRGIHFTRGSRPTLSGAYLARVTREGLATLSKDIEMTRVSVDLPRRTLPPLDATAKETGALLARRALLARSGKELDGAGTVIADIDTPVDSLHPAFFRADAGAYAWVDVDGDGLLTLGVDGVDLDGSGTIEPAEVLRTLPSKGAAHDGSVVAQHTEFTPDLDYLFLDTNGNAKRDAGKGFSETTPAYGEPLFVFDDANHDGILQATERVLRLGSSKFKIIRSGENEYARGGAGRNALVAYDPARSPRAGQTTHATGVDGVLVGGQPGISRWLGIAPGAELLLHETDGSENGTVSAVQWAIDHGANVILTEYAQYSFVSLDGSSEDEAIVDAANDAGILTVSPSGNLAGTKKHRTVTVAPGTSTLEIRPDSAFFGSASLASVSLHYKGAARNLTTSFKLPSGSTYVVPETEENGVAMDHGVVGYSSAAQTPRDTHEQSIALLNETSTFERGTYELQLTLDAGSPVEVDVYLGDDVSLWEGGFHFSEDTPSRTMCSPSTSDKTIAVGAYIHRDDPAFYPAGALGDVATYSSRGPLLFDRPLAGVDLIAPDNSMSAAPRGESGLPLYQPSSGTSSAGPVVAGAIALLRQAFPGEPAGNLKTRLYDSARPEGTMSGGESASGHGKLDIAAAIGATVLDGTAPEPRLDVVTEPFAASRGATLRVDATDDEPREALRVRWDLDYDGQFDTDWLPLGEQVVPVNDLPAGSTLGVKAEVRDGQGNTRAATAKLTVLPPAAIAPTANEATTDAGCSCRVMRRTTAPHPFAIAIAIAVLARHTRWRRRSADRAIE